MKVEVIGSKEIGRVIQGGGAGKVKVGQEIVITHAGKVKIGVVVRTRGYTKTKVSYDMAGVVLKGQGVKAKGPIAKGVGTEIQGQSRQQI